MKQTHDVPVFATVRQPVDRVTVGAMLLAPVGYAVACLAIPYDVDELPTSRAKMAHTLEIVSRHAFATRLGFLGFSVGMLFLIPGMAVLRALTDRTARGGALVDIGARLVAVGAGAAAIGNAFAPASEPSAIRSDLPRAVMVAYMRHHLVNGWDWTIIAFYPLLPIGGILLGIGLWRSGALTRPTTLLVALPLVALVFPPLCPPTVVIAAALATGLVLVAAQTRGRLTPTR